MFKVLAGPALAPGSYTVNVRLEAASPGAAMAPLPEVVAEIKRL